MTKAEKIMITFHIVINDSYILKTSFTDEDETGSYVQRCLSGEEDLTEEIGEDLYIWKLDIELRDEDGETLNVITIWEDTEWLDDED